MQSRRKRDGPTRSRNENEGALIDPSPDVFRVPIYARNLSRVRCHQDLSYRIVKDDEGQHHVKEGWQHLDDSFLCSNSDKDCCDHHAKQ